MIRTAAILILGTIAGCSGVTRGGAESSESDPSVSALGTVDMGYAPGMKPEQTAADELYGSIFMAVPPAAAEAEGIKAVHVTAIDGVPAKHEIGRTIRLTAGPHEISFMRPNEEAEAVLLVLDIEADLNYWVGWHETEDSWEPVVYIVQRR